MMWDYGMGWGGWLVMSVLMVAFWAAVVFGIIALFRRSSGGNSPFDRQVAASEEDAVQVLQVRFARGEIDEQEYRSRLAVLRANTHGE